MDAYYILKRPLITEKTMSHADKGKFSFEVALGADKTHIKNAVEDQFKVHVKDVATVIIKGRTKRIGTRRNEITESPWKKAVVTLAKGEKINFFETEAK